MADENAARPQRVPTRVWHTMTSEEALDVLDVDAAVGLDETAVGRLRNEHGANALDEAPKASVFRRLLKLLADRMTIVLLIAAAVSAIVSREWETPVADGSSE